MLLIRRERLLPPQTRTQHSSTPGQIKADRVCRDYLLQFAQLRQNLKEEKRMLFVIAELHALKNAAWQRFYVDAVKMASSSCPMVVWHPKRNRCQVLDCNYVQTTQHALEQTLDGNAKSWGHRPWPGSQHQ